jgi:hypothetical protein
VRLVIDPAALQLGALTGWLDRQEQAAIAYLIEENRLLPMRGTGRRPLQNTSGVPDAVRAGYPAIAARVPEDRVTDQPLRRNARLGEVVDRLVQAYHPERIYLFGSMAR